MPRLKPGLLLYPWPEIASQLTYLVECSARQLVCAVNLRDFDPWGCGLGKRHDDIC